MGTPDSTAVMRSTLAVILSVAATASAQFIKLPGLDLSAPAIAQIPCTGPLQASGATRAYWQVAPYDTKLPRDVYLSMVEANQAHYLGSHGGSMYTVEWWKTDPNMTAYMHATRCEYGNPSSIVTNSITGTAFKTCSSLAGIHTVATYAVPTASMCQEACVQNQDCVFYTVGNSMPSSNAPGIPANCWLSAPNNHTSNYTAWYQIPASAQLTKKPKRSMPIKGDTDYWAIPNVFFGSDCPVQCSQLTDCTSVKPATYGRNTYTSASKPLTLDASLLLVESLGANALDSIGSIEFWPQNASTTSYMHKSRCPDGSNATYVQSPSAAVFKVCKSDANIVALAKYQLPPFLCRQSCDEDPRCTFYTTDTAGGCWTATTSSNANSAPLYFLV